MFLSFNFLSLIFLSLLLWNDVDCVTGACRASVMCSSLIGVLVTRDFQLPLLVG